MKQLILSFILMLLPLAASADDSGSCGGNVTYNYVEATQTLTISGTGTMYNYITSSPPWESYKSSIIKVVINEGVKSIGYNAFNQCSGLISITIPMTLTSIDKFAFSGCSNLTSVHITNLESWFNISFSMYNSNPLSVAHHLFLNGDEIKDLVIPSSVTNIGYRAFEGCSGLTSVTIPENVKSIGSCAFSECGHITTVTIQEGLTTIGSSAFYMCSNLTSITIPESVTSIESGAFHYCSSLTSATIPKSVTIIEENTFRICRSLTNVSLPEGLKQIKKEAFCGCKALESIMIPASVEYIYAEAFDGCSKLKEVKALPENPPFLFENAFSNYDDITLKMPKASEEAYMTTSPWDKFGSYQTLTGEDITKKKCAKPTITFENGVVHFACETEDVTYKYNISGASSGEGNDIGLASITVSVYATKSGYEDSDTTTLDIATSGIRGDVDGNGEVNVADHVELSKIIMGENQE